MSDNIIKGFPADGGIAKYDFGALANVPEPLKKMPTAKVGDFLKVSAVDDSGEVVAVEAADLPDGSENTSGGLSATAANLLIDILESAMFNTNVSGKIASLKEALASGGGDSGDTGEDSGGETVADDITVADGVMTIIAVGSAVNVADGVMTIA